MSMKTLVLLLLLIMPAAAMNYTICTSDDAPNVTLTIPGNISNISLTPSGCLQLSADIPATGGASGIDYSQDTGYFRVNYSRMSLDDYESASAGGVVLRGPTQAERDAMWKNNPPALYIAPLGLKIPLAPWMVGPLHHILSYF